ncbi:MAG: acyltransferase family protein [Planctomycetota bacterium]
MKYRAEVDGLRAVAVVAVLFYHAKLGCPGGYIGVDVFFVISGYLITGLILHDIDKGKFQIGNFWERRFRRILPALIVVLSMTLAAGWCLLPTQVFRELGKSTAYQALLVSNVYFWRLNAGYFAQTAEEQPLLHTWSLAVEEQFYLFFPLLLVLVSRLMRNNLSKVLSLIAVCSFALCVYGSYTHESATFYFLPTRAWELLLGAFLAERGREPRASASLLDETLGLAGLFAILSAAMFYSPETRFPGLAALLPCGGTALLIWANGGALTMTGRLLAWRPIVFIGLISYSLYLWHWPMLVFFNYWVLGPAPLWRHVLPLLVSVFVAALSWKFVEGPFRKGLVLNRRARVFAAAGAALAALLAAGLTAQLEIVRTRMPEAAQRYFDGRYDEAPERLLDLQQVRNENFIELGLGDKSRKVDFFVWGDSHATAVLPIVNILCKEYALRGVAATRGSTAPLIGYTSFWRRRLLESIPYNDAVVAFITKNHVHDVLLVAKWRWYIDIDGSERIHSALLATTNALKRSGARIWILKMVPDYEVDVPKALAASVWFGSETPSGRSLTKWRKFCPTEETCYEGLDLAGITVLDPAQLFVGPANTCRTADCGRSLYSDSHHLTAQGALLLRPLFEPIFASLRKARELQ